jgi:hypothetical protein
LLLPDAVKARLPIITVHTRDLMNFTDTVKFVTGHMPVKFLTDKEPKAGTLYYIVAPTDKVFSGVDVLYKKFVGAGTSLIIVNSIRPIQEAFDAGEVFAPIDQVRKSLITAFEAKDHSEMMAFVEELLPTLGGLTLKEVGEVIRLTEVRFDGLTPQGVTRTRALLVPDMQGFSAVSTTMDGPYLPNDELVEFAAEHKELFLDPETDPRLVPKGLLGDGTPGTGKTQGTKWLADQWGVPLYRLDASILNKYYGESENNLKAIFGKVAHEAPCILLIDEAEKLLGIGDKNDNMMDRIRGMLLWQMQESRDRVFYMLTTNDKKKLPPELIREGRIEKTITFEGLLKEEAVQFGAVILKSFLPKPAQQVTVSMEGLVNALFTTDDRVAHSRVTAAVKTAVKLALKEGGK